MANVVKVASVQLKCSKSVEENIENAKSLVLQAIENGANIILLPELFEREYFCQQRRYDFLLYAQPLEQNKAVKTFAEICKKYGVVMPISFYEKDINILYNSAAIIDADGEILGVYRKTHIPDDHYYQEKFYFTNGNTGYKVFDTKFGRIGVGICWDQWFPETARGLALGGAEIIFYPTAIGSEPILGVNSCGHWTRVMQGHSGANLVPVVAANRIGTETVEPCEENGGQSSALTFYGSSFMTDNTGEIIARAGQEKQEIIYAEYDLEKYQRERLEWGLFRDYIKL